MLHRQAVLATVLLVTSLSAWAQTAPAESQFDATHPRRAEVNSRLANQNARIAQEKSTGQISGAQAKQLHAQDHAIRTEERADAAVNGGHITKAEQGAINHQENQQSKAIGK
jgi:hypothetical protein